MCQKCDTASKDSKNLDTDDDNNDSTQCSTSPKHHMHLQSHANMAAAAEHTVISLTTSTNVTPELHLSSTLAYIHHWR